MKPETSSQELNKMAREGAQNFEPSRRLPGLAYMYAYM